MSRSNQPRVFVSSTVHDFRDLRSALKFWLEEFGCQVLMSEHTDFEKPLDANSYDACLRAIDSCDYFILLVGARVGGFYDQGEKLSITRKEYRHAYARARKGQLKLLPFVRKELWDIREDRKALVSFLRTDYAQTREFGDDEIRELERHSSRFANDAASIFSFLEEIAQTDQMKLAATGGATRPVANWLHFFANFDDLVATLRPALGLSGNLRKRGMEVSLVDEILRNLSLFIEYSTAAKRFLPTSRVWTLHRSSFLGAVTPDPRGQSEFDADTFGVLAIYALGGITDTIDTTFLHAAIRSGEFLEYDASRGNLRVGQAQRALLNLAHAVKWFLRADRSHTNGAELVAMSRASNPDERVVVDNVELLTMLTYLEAHLDLFQKLVATYHFLVDGVIPDDRPRVAALRGIFGRSPHSIASTDDVLNWLSLEMPVAESETN